VVHLRNEFLEAMNKSDAIRVRVDPQTEQRLKEASQSTRKTRSEIIRDAVNEYLAKGKAN